MALADKFQDLMAQMEAMKSEVADLEKPKEDQPSVDLSKLQDQIKALGEERDKKAKEASDLRAAIQAHLDDDKADQEKLQKAIEPIEEVPVEAPVPQVEQPDPVPASEAPKESKPVEGNDQLTDITRG